MGVFPMVLQERHQPIKEKSTTVYHNPAEVTGTHTFSFLTSFYHITTIISFATLNAINSLPKLDASTVFYRFEYHITGAF